MDSAFRIRLPSLRLPWSTMSPSASGGDREPWQIPVLGRLPVKLVTLGTTASVAVLIGLAGVAGNYGDESRIFTTEVDYRLNRLVDGHRRLQRAVVDLASGRTADEIQLDEARAMVAAELRWIGSYTGTLPGSMAMVADIEARSFDQVAQVSAIDLAAIAARSWPLMEEASAIMRNQQSASWFASSISDVAESQVTLFRRLLETDAPLPLRQTVNRSAELAIKVAKTGAYTDAQKQMMSGMISALAGAPADVAMQRDAFVDALVRLVSSAESAQEMQIEAGRFETATAGFADMVAAEQRNAAVSSGGLGQTLGQLYGPLLLAALVAGILGSLTISRAATVNAWREARDKQDAEKRNDDTNDAILRLLEEISGMTAGNLSARATVSENDVTGVIADAFNAMAKRLADVVRDIKSSSGAIATSSGRTISAAKQVSDAAQTQKDELVEAAQNIAALSGLVTEAYEATREAARVAGMSRDGAERGRVAVTDAIGAMSQIRTQIQEASKRLKRVGELSQEVTTITDAIRDITERTGVLAVNANIRAAEAGEAGRSFAALATEIQRLAVRSASALNKINDLTNAMQSDTRGAITAMEETTQQVVSGTGVAARAGDALEVITMVSGELADLVEQVDGYMNQQIASAREIDSRMDRVRTLAVSSAESIQATTADIEHITDLAGSLDKSVANLTV